MLLRYIFFFSLLLLTTLGIFPSAGFSGFIPTAPNIVYGSAGKTIAGAGQLGKKVAKNAGNIVKKKPKLKNNATKGANKALRPIGSLLENVDDEWG